ncbi:hypothetical protein F4802DRAFT_116217 [Xylaria palmicola]|nr:hypothetical protein F4802DRAFT_116217 [Xylaria palmicola]
MASLRREWSAGGRERGDGKRKNSNLDPVAVVTWLDSRAMCSWFVGSTTRPRAGGPGIMRPRLLGGIHVRSRLALPYRRPGLCAGHWVCWAMGGPVGAARESATNMSLETCALSWLQFCVLASTADLLRCRPAEKCCPTSRLALPRVAALSLQRHRGEKRSRGESVYLGTWIDHGTVGLSGSQPGHLLRHEYTWYIYYK